MSSITEQLALFRDKTIGIGLKPFRVI